MTTPALTIQSTLRSLSLPRSPLIKKTALVGGKPTYTVTKSDRGQRLTVRVTAIRAGWATKTATCAAMRAG